jgi:hypothetical protein
MCSSIAGFLAADFPLNSIARAIKEEKERYNAYWESSCYHRLQISLVYKIGTNIDNTEIQVLRR